MIEIRPSNERGGGDYGWLDARHTFSFDQYRDPRWAGFRTLRAINEDHVAPSAGFPMHPHRDMEIITYVLEGALAHKDSMGNGSIIRPGDGQRMSAGTGVRHSEKSLPEEEKRGRFRLIASPDGADGSVTIHQDAKLYVSLLSPGQQVQHEIAVGRFGWLQVAKGAVELNGKALKQGDGAAADAQKLVIKAGEDSEVLLFDLT